MRRGDLRKGGVRKGVRNRFRSKEMKATREIMVPDTFFVTDRQQNLWVKMELVSSVDVRFLRHDRANE
jgi:hypothetical protein